MHWLPLFLLRHDISQSLKIKRCRSQFSLRAWTSTSLQSTPANPLDRPESTLAARLLLGRLTEKPSREESWGTDSNGSNGCASPAHSATSLHDSERHTHELSPQSSHSLTPGGSFTSAGQSPTGGNPASMPAMALPVALLPAAATPAEGAANSLSATIPLAAKPPAAMAPSAPMPQAAAHSSVVVTPRRITASKPSVAETESLAAKLSACGEMVELLHATCLRPRPTFRDALFFPDTLPGCASHEKLIALIEAARYSLDVCVYCVTDGRLVHALKAKADAGLVVRVVSDDDQAFNPGARVWELAQFAYTVVDEPIHPDKRGREAADSEFQRRMHHKFVIIDHRVLATGSFNWTLAARTRNCENVLVTSEPELVAAFEVEFERLHASFASSNAISKAAAAKRIQAALRGRHARLPPPITRPQSSFGTAHARTAAMFESVVDGKAAGTPPPSLSPLARTDRLLDRRCTINSAPRHTTPLSQTSPQAPTRRTRLGASGCAGSLSGDAAAVTAEASPGRMDHACRCR